LAVLILMFGPVSGVRISTQPAAVPRSSTTPAIQETR
jgi:hypothetical protein